MTAEQPANPVDLGGRDNFGAKVLTTLGRRAGYLCSFPGCHRLTVGPSEDRQSRTSITGVGAHITAASENGPRYDKDLSPEQRAGEDNGVWLCQIHGKHIDDNPTRYTARQLRSWKFQHENWVFQRLANGDNHIEDGVTRLNVTRVGVVAHNAPLRLGRFNLVLGGNGSGKTTLCQALAAFSGGSNFELFAERFDLWSPGKGELAVSAASGHMGVMTQVTLTKAVARIHGPLAGATVAQLHVEVDGGVVADWPRGRFPMLFFDNLGWDPSVAFEVGLQRLAQQLQMSEAQIWDSLRDDLNVTGAFGYQFRRTGSRSLEVLSSPGEFWCPSSQMANSDRVLALTQIALGLLQRQTHQDAWTFVYDTNYFLLLDRDNKARLVRKLLTMEKPAIQIVACVLALGQVDQITDSMAEAWTGASEVGRLVVHSFTSLA